MLKMANWKKKFLKIPENILQKVRSFETGLISVAAVKKVKTADISSGVYSHIGLTVSELNAQTTFEIVPNAENGNASKKNLFGWEIVRKDLPMISKTFTVESPNFGDKSKGTHPVDWSRDVYQRESFEPTAHSIIIEFLKITEADAVIKFKISNDLDRNEPKFEENLLFALNLLQENTGAADVFQSDTPNDVYLSTIHLDWEIFPAGTADEVVSQLGRTKSNNLSPQSLVIIAERVNFFNALKPKNFIQGTGKFHSYFGAMFADDLVVFENLRYGNAIYVLYENWEEVSKMSRIDLLRGTSERYDRFPHLAGWQSKLKNHLKLEIAKRKPKIQRKLI